MEETKAELSKDQSEDMGELIGKLETLVEVFEPYQEELKEHSIDFVIFDDDFDTLAMHERAKVQEAGKTLTINLRGKDYSICKAEDVGSGLLLIRTDAPADLLERIKKYAVVSGKIPDYMILGMDSLGGSLLDRVRKVRRIAQLGAKMKRVRKAKSKEGESTPKVEVSAEEKEKREKFSAMMLAHRKKVKEETKQLFIDYAPADMVKKMLEWGETETEFAAKTRFGCPHDAMNVNQLRAEVEGFLGSITEEEAKRNLMWFATALMHLRESYIPGLSIYHQFLGELSQIDPDPEDPLIFFIHLAMHVHEKIGDHIKAGDNLDFIMNDEGDDHIVN